LGRCSGGRVLRFLGRIPIQLTARLSSHNWLHENAAFVSRFGKQWSHQAQSFNFPANSFNGTIFLS
jgi:hypothetical protein